MPHRTQLQKNAQDINNNNNTRLGHPAFSCAILGAHFILTQPAGPLPLVALGMAASSRHLMERHQATKAISMERLNCLKQNKTSSASARKDNNNGSISSGASDSSLDELADEQPLGALFSPEAAAHLNRHQRPGLSRSASRVSRFRSAKEFFERLSSNANASPSPFRFERRLSPGRGPRGNVASRYTAATEAARALSASNLTLALVSPSSSSSSSAALPGPATHHRHDTQRLQQASEKSKKQGAPSAPTIKPEALVRQAGPPPACRTTSPAIQPPNAELNHLPIIKRPAELEATTTSTATASSPQTNTHKLSKPLVSIQPYVNNEQRRFIITANNESTCAPPRLDSPHHQMILDTDEDIRAFQGDNVIVGAGSLLSTRNKQLKIKFDDTPTSTYEYPSEQVMLAEPDEAAPVLSEAPNLNAAAAENNGEPPTHQDAPDSASRTKPSSSTCSQKQVVPFSPLTSKLMMSNGTAAYQFSPKNSNVTLSNYLPSVLLATKEDNIDSQFGVKKMSTPSKLVTPVAKSRVSVDQWSSNNGTVIYAQSSSLKGNGNQTASSFNTKPANHSGFTIATTKDRHQTTRAQLNADISNTDSPDGRDLVNVRNPNGNVEKDLKNRVSYRVSSSDRNDVPNVDIRESPHGGHSSPDMTADGENGISPQVTQNFDRDLYVTMSTTTTTNWSNGSCTTSNLLF